MILFILIVALSLSTTCNVIFATYNLYVLYTVCEQQYKQFSLIITENKNYKKISCRNQKQTGCTCSYWLTKFTNKEWHYRLAELHCEWLCHCYLHSCRYGCVKHSHLCCGSCFAFYQPVILFLVCELCLSVAPENQIAFTLSDLISTHLSSPGQNVIHSLVAIIVYGGIACI